MLPSTTGPFGVSFVDLRIFKSDNCDLKTNLSSVFCRIYYPSCLHKSKWHRVSSTDSSSLLGNWIPSHDYYEGYSIFLKIPKWIGSTLIGWYLGHLKTNAMHKLKLLSPEEMSIFKQMNYKIDLDPAHPANPIVKKLEGHQLYPTHWEIPHKFPVFLFSHGLWGTRTTYSSLLTELASHGWVVFAVEHSDGSASFTHTTNTQFVDISRKDDHLKEYSLPYIQPPEEVVNDDKKLHIFRHSQLKHRVAEMNMVSEYIHDLNRSKENRVYNAIEDYKFSHFKENYLKKYETKKKYFSSSDDSGSMFAGQLNADITVLAGHSFGGATVLECAVQPEDRDSLTLLQKSIKAMIVLDPWMLPISQNLRFMKGINKVPILSIHSENFHTKENVDSLEKYLDASSGISTESEPSAPRIVTTVIGTTHHSPSDLPMLLPAWISKWIFQGSSLSNKIDPYHAILLNSFLMRYFICRYVTFQSLVTKFQFLEKGLTYKLDENEPSSASIQINYNQ